MPTKYTVADTHGDAAKTVKGATIRPPDAGTSLGTRLTQSINRQLKGGHRVELIEYEYTSDEFKVYRVSLKRTTRPHGRFGGPETVPAGYLYIRVEG